MYYLGQNITSVNNELEKRQQELYSELEVYNPGVYARELEQGKGLAISIDDSNKISYAVKEEFLFDDEKRTKTTLQRYIRRQLNYSVDEISDHELNDLCNNVMKTFNIKEFKLAKGLEIAELYNSGFAQRTCMTDKGMEDTENILGLYVNNPQTVNLAVITNGSMKARAICWIVKNKVYVDRIYQNSEVIENEFKNSIKTAFTEKDVFFRKHGNLPEDREFNENITIEIPDNFNSEFPYLDTFRYFEISNDSVFLSNSKDGMDYIANSTNGGYSDIEYNICEYCENDMGEEEGTFVNGYGRVCDYCLNEHFTYCDECREYHYNERITYIKSSDKNVCDNCLGSCDYHYCEECGECFYIDNMHFTDDGNYCDDCYSCKYTSCELCGKEILINDTQDIGNQSYCDDCYTQIVEEEAV